MPHVAIKMVRGCSEEQKRKAAEACRDAIIQHTGKGARYVSVTVEDYDVGEWEGVYNEYIASGDKDVFVKPGYTNPKTFA